MQDCANSGQKAARFCQIVRWSEESLSYRRASREPRFPFSNCDILLHSKELSIASQSEKYLNSRIPEGATARLRNAPRDVGTQSTLRKAEFAGIYKEFLSNICRLLRELCSPLLSLRSNLLRFCSCVTKRYKSLVITVI